MRKKARFLIFVLPLLLILSAVPFVVREGNPSLASIGAERHWKGLPFTGLVVGFYKNYRPAVLASYWKGQHHGWEIFWYPNGHRERDVSYRNGLYHGASQSWYEDGRIKTWRDYANGLAQGEQWAWGQAGQVLEYNVYENDQEITHKTWTFDGRPFHNYVYQKGEKVGLLGEPFCKRKQQL